MKRVTGIGGIFFKAKNPKELAAWYEKHLGINFGGNSYASFMWKDDAPDGRTVFSLFPEDTDYFQPSRSSLMINLRVENLDALLEILKSEGVETVGEPETFEYGKFPAGFSTPKATKSNSGSRLTRASATKVLFCPVARR